MQQVFFPGHAGQPCLGEYTIVLDRSETFSRAEIVLVSRAAHGGESFWNSDLGRNTVLNRILASDLEGVRLEWIRLFVLVEKTGSAPGRMPEFLGVELKIELDVDDFVDRGNRCNIKRPNILSRLFTGISRKVCYWSGDVVGGCAKVTASFKQSRDLEQEEIHTLCRRIGLKPGSPAGSAGHNGPAASTNTLSSASYH
mgnify:CR=1 FL=1